MVADKLPRSPNILSRHADVIGFERGIQDDLALLAILDDVERAACAHARRAY